MNVTCEGCESKFKVDESKIRPTGSKVRCSKCRHVFTVYPPAAPEGEEELLVLEEELPPEKEAGAALAGVDERLDDLLGEKPTEAAGKGGPAGDDLSAELNLDDLLAGIPPAEEKPSAEKEPSAEGLELELDLDLPGIEAEREQASAPAEPVLPSTDELELDLADLSFLEEGKPAKEEAPAKPAAGDELELDLASFLEQGGEAGGGETTPPADSPAKEAASSAAVPDEDELDLSDLEAMLEGEGSTSAEVKKPSATEGIDLELDLASEIGGKTKGGEVEELDLAAIVEPLEKEETPAQAEKTAVKTEELDFSDLEAILEGEGQAAPAVEKKPAGEELLFGEEKETAPVAALPEDEETLDLEKLLAEEENTAAMHPAGETEKREAEDLDLDLFLEPAVDKKTEEEPEFVIEPLAEEEEKAVKAAAAAAGVAATAAGAAAVLAAAKARAAGASDGASTDPFSPAAPAAGGATAVLETQPQEEEADFGAEEKKKSRPRSGGFVKRLVYALIVLVVVAAGALIVPRQLGLNVPFLSEIEIPFLADLEVPFLGKVFKATPQDEAGALRIRPVADTVQAEYVENATAGRIVVIRGQVRNEYDHPRSFIKVTAKLYDKNKNVVRAGTVWAGNTLSKEDLASKDMAAIGDLLKNQKGQQNRNVGVKPGMTVPFMVVFDKLPGNLEEYSVEAAGSTR